MKSQNSAESHQLSEALDRRKEEQQQFLAELVKMPSDNPPGDCRAHAERTATLLEELGFEVERHPVPAALCERQGMVSATNLVVRRRFGPGPTVALNAHGDVVAPGEGWSRDPYGAEVDDGVMYGRGVAVSKSDIATYTYALLALMDARADLGGTVELHFTYDEEAGGEIGPKWLLDQGLSAPDYAISAGFAYAVVNAHNGCLHLEVELTGKSAHAAMPHTGQDALAAATTCLQAIYAENDRLARRRSTVAGIDAPSVTVGLISGGINTNVVPDRVTFRLDRRMIPEEDPREVERGLRELIESSCSGRVGIQCQISQIMLATPLKEVPGTRRLAEIVSAQACNVLQEDVPIQGVPLYTDARHYSNAGIPTVIYGAGPRSILEANAHRADENLLLSDLHGATEVVAKSLLDLFSRY